jgi:CelD/BcsL family acetyltransferase involved in cellulose biosynthesis
MLHYHCLSPEALTPDHWSAWAEIQASEPSLASPYFRAEFTQAVARVRSDVQVGVIERGGRPVGFFPFQRGDWGIGAPVAGRLSDFHGVVAAADLEFDVAALLRGCRMNAWDFHHLLASQRPFAGQHDIVEPSPYLDLSQGFDHYRAAKSKDSDEIQQTLRKWRKFEREVAPLRLDYHTDDKAVFETLLAWKAAQYESTGLTNLFAFEWVVELLRDLLGRRTADFGGVLSALYAGDNLVAMHFGMRSRGVLHSWFPVYDKDLHKWSPGRMLLVAMAQACEPEGITRIDLGRGTEQHKHSFGSASVDVAEGAAEVGSPVTAVRQAWRATRRWIRNSPVWSAAQYPAAWTRSFREWLTFR